ncbi:NAD(+) synthase [Oligosphaera ethanolica]|uniref:Glutamine-dependent NAD(+) synthetase n=1 Tax=Oligosphaera ethanolica TaxID=760260 RepID=A0AAE4AMR2_9BACT|nr:NAD(+) synthase [Oligosphaera ethanolica]MDQ0288655.1 NAD+ synthase (glutamine-hydrolyzing) [Oligosphaera ethanolica]NLE55755.1 NAD(+) synthase [Lentisphaerota bacterium]HQL09048.1 NAD(+) synthase [Lentisphaeria bacterium]
MRGVYRIAAAVPALKVGNPAANADGIIAQYREAVAHGAAAVLFPELAITGYSCGDLFEQHALLDAALAALQKVQDATRGQPALLIVGVPILCGTRLFNCAAVIRDGDILALVGKTYLPNYREFYEKRQFRSIRECPATSVVINGRDLPIGADMVFTAGDDCHFAVELCEDLWAVTPPSNNLALNGAQIIFNLSAGPELVAKADYRRTLVASQSARLCAVYALAGAGVHESTSDLVFSGHAIIAENGRVCAENQRFERTGSISYADVVPRWLDSLRRAWTSFNDCPTTPVRRIALPALPVAPDAQYRALSKQPFVPANSADREQRCREILTIQATGLAKRLEHTRAKRLVIGLSGGLDSTLAILVAAWACDMLKLPHKTICAITMPGMGTSSRTKSNASAIAKKIGAELRTIDITKAVTSHFQDIGHDPKNLNVVYENCQARERTQILMDVANAVGGIVVGTGDLSEIALGWSTFNGDHMSMYCVNCGVPKTLVRYLVEFYAASADDELARLLLDVNATPVSPELLPEAQHTEELLGCYELHDFFLYYFLKYGERPDDLLEWAYQTFAGCYEPEHIRATLATFLKRFFSQQFKRNAMPDGPKVGTIALSPRGDWRMPADADAAAWL